MREELYVIMNKDHTKIMKGLSKSGRYLTDINDNFHHIGTFSTKKSAEVWLKKTIYEKKKKTGKLENPSYEWKKNNLEVVKIDVNYEV